MGRMVSVVSAAVLAVCLLAGCGSSSAGSSSSAALNTELSYFQPGSPFVMTVVTDPHAAAVQNFQALVRKIPIAQLGESALIAKLQQVGIDYQSDVHPLWGNPLVLGISGSLSRSSIAKHLLVVWITKSASALNRIVTKLHLRSSQNYDGAKLYSNGSSTNVAVDGATVVLAQSAEELKAALDLHAHGGGMTGADRAQATSGLPPDSLIQAFGNLSGVLSSPSAAKARRIPWVAALKGYAASISANSTGLSLDFKLDTTGLSLTSSQLPIAAGSATPKLVQTMPIAVGIRDPGQIASFVESAVQAVDPGKYAAFLRRQAVVRQKTGVDLNTLLSELSGDLIVATDLHKTMARVGLSDPAAASQTLAKLASQARGVLPHATSVTRVGGFYEITNESGSTVTLGIVGNQLVVGKTTPSQLQAFASAPTSPASGAHGAVAFRVALPALIQLAIKSASSPMIQQVLSSLGDITGWASASTSGITGHATLAIK